MWHGGRRHEEEREPDERQHWLTQSTAAVLRLARANCDRFELDRVDSLFPVFKELVLVLKPFLKLSMSVFKNCR